MTAEDRNVYGVDVAEIRPGHILRHGDITVVAVDWPDLAAGTLAVAYVANEYRAGMAPDLTVALSDVSD